MYISVVQFSPSLALDSPQYSIFKQIIFLAQTLHLQLVLHINSVHVLVSKCTMTAYKDINGFVIIIVAVGFMLYACVID